MSEEDDMSSPIDDELEEYEEPVLENIPEEREKPVLSKMKTPKLPDLKPDELLNEKTPLSFNALAVLAAGFFTNSPQLASCFGSFAEKLQNPYVKTVLTVLVYIIIVIGYTKFVSK